jgi:hypothetical protein
MQERFVRVSSAYGAAQGGIRLHRYELEGDVPASMLDPLTRTKEFLGEEVMRQLSGAPHDPALLPGGLLARIWTVFGPPREGRLEEHFYYLFLDRQTGTVFSVYSHEAGIPAYQLEGIYTGPLPVPDEPDHYFRPDTTTPLGLLSFLNTLSLLGLGKYSGKARAQQRLQASARAFEVFVAPHPLADCGLVVNTEFGLHGIGAEHGRPVHRRLTFDESVDFFIDLIERFGPSRDLPVFYLARPELSLLLLWIGASPSQRASRPDALSHAQRGWQRELEKLADKLVLEPDDQSEWEREWSFLDEALVPVELDRTHAREKLQRLREPPSLPSLTSLELATLRSALWVRSAAPNWSDREREQRAADDERLAARGPEYDPARIIERLSKSKHAADQRVAAQLRTLVSAP